VRGLSKESAVRGFAEWVERIIPLGLGFVLQLFYGLVNTANYHSGTRALDAHRSSCKSSMLSKQGE